MQWIFPCFLLFFLSCCHRYFSTLFIVHRILHLRDFPARVIVLIIALRLLYAFVHDIIHYTDITLFNYVKFCFSAISQVENLREGPWDHHSKYLGRAVQPGNSRFRVIPVILWKQYSGRKLFGFFPMLSARFLPESTGSGQESTRKIRNISGRNTTSMFQRFAVLSLIFSARSWEIRLPESSTWVVEARCRKILIFEMSYLVWKSIKSYSESQIFGWSLQVLRWRHCFPMWWKSRQNRRFNRDFRPD